MRVGAHHAGPYEWVHVIHPDGLNSFDMGVWQEDDGSAFLVRSVNNEYLGISQLAPDYSTTTGLVSTAPRVSFYTVTRLNTLSTTWHHIVMLMPSTQIISGGLL